MILVFFDGNCEKVLHVSSGQKGLDSVAGTFEGGFLPFDGLIGMALEGDLQPLEFLLTFADFASEGFELRHIEKAIKGHEHGPLDSKKLFTGSVGPDCLQKVGVKATHGLSAYRQEVGMLRWYQGADEVERPLLDSLEVFLRVIAFVKDQANVLDPLAQGMAPLSQLLGHGGKGRGIMLVARIGMVQQRDLPVGSDQQRQAEEAQVVPAFFAVAPLSQSCPAVEAIDEGKKIGGIKKQAPQIEAKARDGRGGDLLFNSHDGLFVDPLHVIPKSLATQLRSLDAGQPREDGFLIPVPDLCFASGGNTAVQGGNQEVLTDCGALSSAFGYMAINRSNDIELLGYVEGGDQGAELPDDGLLRIWADESEDQLLRVTDVFLPDDLGFTVDASALTEVVIGFTADELFSEAGHLN